MTDCIYKTTLQYEIHERKLYNCYIQTTGSTQNLTMWAVGSSRLIVILHLGRVVDQSRCLLL